MSFMLACKAFMKAWKNPEQAQIFVEEKELPKALEEKPVASSDPSHLRLLAMLQQSGRFIDFIKEDLTGFSDADIGAVARKIHEDCGKCIEEYVTIRPLMQEAEGDSIQVPKGYDASSIKLLGNLKSEPPYQGILVHKGWKAHKCSLPKRTGIEMVDIVCPAEVEVK